MASDSLSYDAAEQYLVLLADDLPMRFSLLACSAGLSLDDNIALQVITSVLPAEKVTPELLWRLKRLSCVWKKWDGSWRLAEDVRVALSDRLDQELPSDRVVELRNRLASHAESKANGFSPDGQITSYRTREARFEAAFQQTLIPGQSNQGVQQFIDIWRKAPPAAREATASAADHLGGELQRRLKRVPPELLFLRGMAARSRHDDRSAERYFREVWENGRQGDIFAIAAHLFGTLVRDRKIAEQALRESIGWWEASHHQAQVWHSLGNLLSQQSERWEEAEEAYRKSLQLPGDPGRRQVWHSLGNLLSQQSVRWVEAEQAYRKSLQLLGGTRHQGQVWHSLGNLLSRQSGRWEEAEQAYRKSLPLLPAPRDQGQVWHSLGNLLSRQSGRWEKAEAAYRKSLPMLGDPHDKGQVWHSLGNLLSRQSGRWEEAEEAYRKSLRLPGDPGHQGQVYGSWAGAMIKHCGASSYSKAEEYANRALSLNPTDLKHQGIMHSLLAKLYEATGRNPEAIKSLRAAIEANRKMKNRRFVKELQVRLDRLRIRLQGGSKDSDDGGAQ
jgi:tetratricopeptide (TPR) repeat protein